MGDSDHAHGRRRWGRLIVLTLVAVGVVAAAAPVALAYDPLDVVCDEGANTMHGDALLATTCYSCHGVTTPVEPITPVDTTRCLTCHWGGYENRLADTGFGTCWSCHYPGENQDDVQTSDGCAAATDCHDIDFANNLPHFGANTKGCVDGCHRTSAQSLPNGSPHHDDGTPGCYDCHDGVKTLEKVHEPYANARDADFGGPFPQCYTCHVGYEETHPDPALIVHRTTAPTYKPAPVVYGGTTVISGFLYTIAPDGTKIPVAGRQVSLLQYMVPEFDWNTVQLKLTLTDNPATTANETGKYIFDAIQPIKNTQYAALVKGEIVGSMIAKPARGAILVKVAPKVTTKLSSTSFALGKSVYVTGKVVPAGTGGSVKWRFQRYVDGAWRTVLTTSAKVLVDNTEGTYSTAVRKYTPTKRGTWRVKTMFVANADYTSASSLYVKFVVK